MRYLKTFEQNNEFSIQEYFQDKIDWNLFRFIQEATTSVADDGIKIRISVMLYTKTRKYSVYQYVVNSPTEEDGEVWVDNNENINDIKGIGTRYGNRPLANAEMEYIVFIYDSGTFIDKLKQKVSSKFNITKMDSYNIAFIFHHTIKPFNNIL